MDMEVARTRVFEVAENGSVREVEKPDFSASNKAFIIIDDGDGVIYVRLGKDINDVQRFAAARNAHQLNMRFGGGSFETYTEEQGNESEEFKNRIKSRLNIDL